MKGLDLIRHENPLKEPLGQYIELSEWPVKLYDNPLANLDRLSISEFERKMLLKQSRTQFEPTRDSVAVASTIQDMLWARVILGNPLIPDNRFRTVQALAQRGKSLESSTWLPDFADAFMLMGCTGLGKTTIIKKYLSSIQQTYIHGRCDAADWSRHSQVTYLIVPMATHRGGLLFGILAALDAILGTEYRFVYANHRMWPIEKLAIEVGVILVQHSVGILIIEEIQARNFGQSSNRDEMLLFVLRILNFGIPVVLVGNPLGFEGLEDFSQDLNRLTENEPIHLMPACETDSEWTDGLGPAMWSHNVMPFTTPWSNEISDELYSCSAAFPGYIRKAVAGAQLLAISQGENSVDLVHLKEYSKNSSSLGLNRRLIDGFAQKDPLKLMCFLDIPWETYGLAWGKLTLEDIANLNPDSSDVADPSIDEEGKNKLRSVHQRMRSAAVSKTTRFSNRVNKGKKSKNSGVNVNAVASGALSAGLEALRQQVAKETPNATKLGV